MGRSFRLFTCFLLSIVYTITVVVSLGANSSAQTEKVCTEAQLRAQGVLIVNCSGSSTCPTNAGTSFSPSTGMENLFVMGDSITVGMVNYGGLMTRLGPPPNGVGLVKDPSYVKVPWLNDISSYKGPSLEATGGWDIQQMERTLASHQKDLEASTTIVIALGTNAAISILDSYQKRLVDFITKVRQYNSSAKILWLNTYFNHRTDKNHEKINPIIAAAIEEVKATDTTAKIEIIDVEAAIKSGELLAPDADSVHYTGKGYEDRAQWLTNTIQEALSSGIVSVGSTNSSLRPGCTCPTGATSVNLTLSENERYSMAWSFFTEQQKLSPEAAAGLMGNLKAESGIDPHNMQNTAPLPDGPSMPVRETADGQVFPDSRIEGSFGYGIAQWTSAGRQKALIDFAAAEGRSTGDMSLQLEFLWQELTTSYTSVLSVLQTPGVTVQEASDEVVLRFEVPGSVILPPDGDATPADRENTLRERGEFGEQIFNQFIGLTGGYSPTANCSSRADQSFGLVDMTSLDQTGAQCAAGTTDAGVIDTYNEGKPAKIRTCSINGGVTVNAQVSGQVLGLINKATADSVALTIGVGFRDIENQIDLYRARCADQGITPSPGPFPYATWNGATRCPGAATPGYSNHGMGFALDLVCNGKLIPMSYAAAQNNQCFQWLLTNASNFGFHEFGNGTKRNADGYEAWHWSVDGG